jgi:signal peptidase I
VAADRRPLAWVFLALVFLALGYLWWRFRSFSVPSSGMEPTILANEKILADLEAYRSSRPKRGDVVVFISEAGFSVKRVIAVEGDTVMGRDRQVFLNGLLLREPYVEHVREGPADGETTFMDNFGPVTVPAGKLFLMGDNRDISYDSRHPDVGLIAIAAVRGKVLQILRSPFPARSGKRIPSPPLQ